MEHTYGARRWRQGSGFRAVTNTLGADVVTLAMSVAAPAVSVAATGTGDGQVGPVR
jgi:hypothetical protein